MELTPCSARHPVVDLFGLVLDPNFDLLRDRKDQFCIEPKPMFRFSIHAPGRAHMVTNQT
jgi:hypothetical protein